MTKLLKLRRNDRCVKCGEDLCIGTEAYWLADTRVVECVPCHSRTATQAAPADAAGGSARAEYERRSERELERKSRAVIDDKERRRQRVEKRPLLGKIANALTPEVTITPESQATKAWAIGAAGEERVAEVLVGVSGIEVLHDRRVPGGKANIDHIVVGPAGVFVVDAKKYQGSIETVDKGSWLRSDWRLYVAGRDRTKLVDGVLGQGGDRAECARRRVRLGARNGRVVLHWSRLGLAHAIQADQGSDGPVANEVARACRSDGRLRRGGGGSRRTSPSGAEARDLTLPTDIHHVGRTSAPLPRLTQVISSAASSRSSASE